MNLFQCKICTKHRVRNLKVNKSSIKVYVNTVGNKWKGDICPTCVRLSKSKLTKQQRYLKKKLLEESIDNTEMSIYHTDNRSCKKCSNLLTTDRWYYCKDCYQIQCIDDDYIYFDFSVDSISYTNIIKHFSI
jgi:hypothetical protein